MTPDIAALDAHEQPSDKLRSIWKSFSKADQQALLDGPDLDDPRLPSQRHEFRVQGHISAERTARAFAHITGKDHSSEAKDVPILYHPLVPGLLIIPDILPPDVQTSLLSLLIHRDLSNPEHQTNMHLHFTLPYPSQLEGTDGDVGTNSTNNFDTSEASTVPKQETKSSPALVASFFNHAPDSLARFSPKDPSVHKPLSVKQVLEKKLHWVTLGGQYDWTNRVYPPGVEAPAYPPDEAAFLEALFPDTRAEAAIVNFYSPGDTMMMHRDVSEETDRGLISLSLGCEGLFMITPNDMGKTRETDAELSGANGEVMAKQEEETTSQEGRPKKEFLLLRLRSGDAIYMTQDARFAWHGVPKILKGTCPEYLADWPAEENGEFAAWKGWMRNKRINLNVRQMKD